MATVQIILFDIDGTLIRSGGAGKQAFEKTIADDFGKEVADHEVLFSGRTDRAIVGDLFTHCGIENTANAWQHFFAAYLRHLPDCMASQEGRVLPGVKKLLEQFQQRPDIAVGLLTGNSEQGAQIKLKHYGIADYFDFGGYGDDHLDRNLVAQDAVSAARQHLSFSFTKQQVCVIGDTPRDIGCGRAIGARVIAVCTGSHTARELAAANPDLLLKDLSDHEPLLEVLLS